jgi:anti-sigma factor RsiW
VDHTEAELLVDLYADGEIDARLAQRFESHLAECEICAGRLRTLNANRAVLSSALAGGPTPDTQRAKILKDIRKAARQEGDRRVTISPWMRYAATIAVTALLTSAAMLSFKRDTSVGSVADTVFNDHLRALATHQMIDVASSDQHTIKPWFDGRLSFAPPVRDLTAKGFPLMGGRVDYIGGRPVAVLVYRRGDRLISLFLRPVRRDQWPAQVVTRRGGFNIVWWSNGTFECWAVSEVPATELLQIRQFFLNGQEGSRL